VQKASLKKVVEQLKEEIKGLPVKQASIFWFPALKHQFSFQLSYMTAQPPIIELLSGTKKQD